MQRKRKQMNMTVSEECKARIVEYSQKTGLSYTSIVELAIRQFSLRHDKMAAAVAILASDRAIGEPEDRDDLELDTE